MEIKEKTVVLRPMLPEDLREFHRWATKTDSVRWWYPEGKQEIPSFRKFSSHWRPLCYAGAHKEGGKGRAFVVLAKGRPVGAINHNKFDARMRGSVDIILDAAECGKGYGTDALKALCSHMFRELGATEIMVTAYKGNARAIRAYEKAGFVQKPITSETRKDKYLLEYTGDLTLDEAVLLVNRKA